MKKLIVVFLILALTLTGCQTILGKLTNDSGAVQNEVQQTVEQQNMIATYIAQTQGAIQASQVVPATAIPVVLATVVPPTKAAALSVKAVATKNANCRSGPAVNFDLVEDFPQGSTATVIAMNTEFGKWWQVTLADGKQCWLIDDALTLSGDTTSVAMVDSPSTPTPKPLPSWAGNWTIYETNGNYAEAFDVSAMPTVIKQTGNQLSFSYSGFGMQFTSSGTVSADGLSFTGYEGGSYGWASQLYAVIDPATPNQFRGKWYTNGNGSNDGWFCGSRNGAPMPNPCRP
jgi:uncharacterized protein YraI